MEMVKLKFLSLKELWKFRLVIDIRVFEMNPGKLTLICQCTDEQIKLAKTYYNAQVISDDLFGQYYCSETRDN